jgi:hypothetical protein
MEIFRIVFRGKHVCFFLATKCDEDRAQYSAFNFHRNLGDTFRVKLDGRCTEIQVM